MEPLLEQIGGNDIKYTSVECSHEDRKKGIKDEY